MRRQHKRDTSFATVLENDTPSDNKPLRGAIDKLQRSDFCCRFSVVAESAWISFILFAPIFEEMDFALLHFLQSCKHFSSPWNEKKIWKCTFRWPLPSERWLGAPSEVGSCEAAFWKRQRYLKKICVLHFRLEFQLLC